MQVLHKPKMVKARKSHLCDWCLRRIEKGEMYQYSFIVDGGDAYGWHECADCLPYVDEMAYEDVRYAEEIGFTTTDYLDWMAENHPGVLPHKKTLGVG